MSLLKKRSVLIYHNRLVAVVLASLLSSVVGATIGVASLVVAGKLASVDSTQAWYTWYGGNVVGNLLIFPLLLNLRIRFRTRNWLSLKEWLVVGAASLLFAVLVMTVHNASLLLLFYPTILLILIYYGITATMMVTNVAALMCAASLLLERGPFIFGYQMVNLFSSILFLLTMATAVLAMMSFHRAQALMPNIKFLSAAWIIAFLGGLNLEIKSLKNDLNHLQGHVKSAKENIIDRFYDYEGIVRGAAAFYRSSDLVTKSDWATFSRDFDIRQLLPGVNALGFIQPVLKSEDAVLARKFAKDGIENFKMLTFNDPNPEIQNAKDRFIVKYIEPLPERGHIVGIDIGSETERRKAAVYARDTGRTAIISNINLLQDPSRTGLLLLVPVYDRFLKKNEASQLKSHHLGWTYAPIFSDIFMKSSIAGELDELDFSITEADSKAFVYGLPTLTGRSRYKVKDQFPLAQKSFFIEAQPNRNFPFTYGKWASIMSAACIITSILVAMVMVNLQLTNRRISQQVKAKTEELLHVQQVSVESSRLASLGEMAGGIAHEINNPLAIILVKVFNLKSRIKKGQISSEEIYPYIDKIEETSYRIAKIVKGMRNLTHDASGTDFERVPVYKIVEDVFDISQEKFKSKGIDVRILVSDKIKIRCRPVQVSQVLINLLNNSEHAIEQLPNPWIEIKSFESVNTVGLEVSDCGLGISEEVASRMMEPFFTTKEVGKGTGLGLSIAQKIMKEHQGSLEYKVGTKYTTFIMRFPKEV